MSISRYQPIYLNPKLIDSFWLAGRSESHRAELLVIELIWLDNPKWPSNQRRRNGSFSFYREEDLMHETVYRWYKRKTELLLWQKEGGSQADSFSKNSEIHVVLESDQKQVKVTENQ